ncbi:unnamed protein product, partial [marine sediment metagenome]
KQKTSNKEKSRTRARVEHLFGFVENSMNGSFVRTIGLARAKAKIGMMNLTCSKQHNHVILNSI